jgi:signal transduction histidine kinase
VRFDKIFERLPGRYLVLNTHFEIVAVNDAYLKASMTTRESILGRYIFDVFPEKPDNPAGGVDRLRESLQSVLGERQTDIMSVTKYDIPHPEAGFEERYWSPVNTPVLDDQGEVSLIIHRVEDVTDYIRLQKRGHVMEQEIFLRSQELVDLNQQLREKNATLENRDRERERLLERLREADRIKSTFFANVSHEFRTPLTLLLGTLQQWHEGEPFTAERRALLIRNAVRLLKLVNNMLDFARVEAGRLHITFIPTDLAQITRRVAAAFETLIGQSGLAYEVACKELSEPVYIDVDSYEKILLNLLSNAFKYTISGKITVRLEQLSGDRVRLIVEDTGIGIPSEELPRIFDRFYRARASAGRAIEGSGIGLALTYELVQMHGGTIEARSELGRGSVFIVELPLGASHLPAEHVTERLHKLRQTQAGNSMLAKPRHGLEKKRPALF